LCCAEAPRGPAADGAPRDIVMKPVRIVLLAFGLAAALGGQTFAQTEIAWWHAMAGAANDVVEELAAEFNASQADYRVVPIFKGTYPETLQAGLAAFAAGDPPHIIQVFDVGT